MKSSTGQEVFVANATASNVWTTALLGISLAVAVASGCDKAGTEGDGTESAAPTAASKGGSEESHEGHAHGAAEGKEAAAKEGDHAGHAHGEAEHVDEVVLTPQAIKNNGIKVAAVKSQLLSATITAPARVAYNAEQVAHVGSAVTGRVAVLKVRVGDVVKKGDELLVIDSPELGEAQSDYLQKRTAVETARPALELAKSAFDRAKRLYDQSQGIPLTDLERLKGEYQAAQGALRSATASVTAAENRLHLLGMMKDAIDALAKSSEISPTYTVRAPLDGRVVEREATLGELVGPDKERLMMLANLNPIWVLADVPEAKLGQIAVGSKASINVPAHSSETFEGVIAYLTPELDSSTRTARVRIEVGNEGTKLLPGMFATAEITAGMASDAEPVLSIAEEAIQTVEGEPAVFVPVEGEPNTFAKRAVGVGQPIGGMVPVFAGLKEGEKYVSSGSFLLKAELGKAGAAHEH